MADIVLIGVTLLFIAVCVAYIGWCDRIIGADPAPADLVAHEEPAVAGATSVEVTA
jgi:hypothetical protein